jgi:hypothetical protein
VTFRHWYPRTDADRAAEADARDARTATEARPRRIRLSREVSRAGGRRSAPADRRRQVTSVTTVTNPAHAERASASPSHRPDLVSVTAGRRAGRVAPFSASTTGRWAVAAIVSVMAVVAGSVRPSAAERRREASNGIPAPTPVLSEPPSVSAPRLIPLPVAADATTPAGQVELFTDAKSGLWAAATTAFCVAAAAGNLTLLAASLGSALHRPRSGG